MDFRGTKTEEHIKAAFAGESQARSRYAYFAEQAHREGEKNVAALFEKMEKNERTHAKIWFRLLNAGHDDTLSNVEQAAAGENYEWQTMYPDFAQQARKDGFPEVAELFEKVASVEKDHERTFLKTYVQMQQKDAEAQEAPDAVAELLYRCMFCGIGAQTYLDVCPVCQAIGAFERVEE